MRMLRACEFAGRLGFGIEARTQEAIHRHRKELDKASPARVTEEIAQLLRCGHAGAAMQWMLDLGLLEVMLPEAYAMVAAGRARARRLRPDPAGRGPHGAAADASSRTSALLAALLLPKVICAATTSRPWTRGR